MNESLEQSPARPGAERPALPAPITRAEVLILEHLHLEYGGAFETYLARVWRDTPITDMESDFKNLRWGSYEHIDQFADDFIEALGWQDALDDFNQAWGIPDSALHWDRAVLLDILSSDYEYLEHEGEVHVFVR